MEGGFQLMLSIKLDKRQELWVIMISKKLQALEGARAGRSKGCKE